MYTFHQLLPLTKGMEFPLGWDEDDCFRKEDLSKLNHLLISGVTGSGKSVFLDSVILNLLAHNGPEKLRLLLCNTKMSEFSCYKESPNLLASPCTSLREVNSALRWALSEGQKRLTLFAENGVRNIASFNDIAWERFDAELPRIVVAVDDLSIIVNHHAYADTIECVRQIFSIGRTTGIHLIAVTQLPAEKRMRSISSQFFAKAIFHPSSLAELRFLAGKRNLKPPSQTGSALFCNGEEHTMIRVLPPADSDFQQILGHGPYLERRHEVAPGSASANEPKPKFKLDDSCIIDDAAEIVVRNGQAVTQVLQHSLRIDYEYALELLSQLEELGLVSAPDEAGRRRVLITKEQWDAALSQIEED